MGAEKDLDRNEWLASILAHSPDIISILDPEGTLRYLNRTAPGSDPAHLIGRNAGDFVPPSHREVWAEAVNRAVATGEPQHVEIFSLGDYWWQTRIVPIRQDGRVTWLVSIGTDVSARKRAETELAMNQHKLALALEASGMGQWSWDVTSNKVVWDAATKRLFEWPEDDDDVTFDAFLARVHPADRDRILASTTAAVEAGDTLDHQHRLELPSGATPWVLGKGRVVRGPDGKATSVIGGVVDITAGKRTEEQLQRSHKLEAIGQLAGGVAHDFNNLLVVILGNLTLAKKTADVHARDALLDDALKAGDRAAEVTRHLLAFSRRQPLNQEVIDLRAIVDDTLRLLRRLLPENIAIDILHAHRTLRVLGDRGQLEQVLLNLCVNARDAMPNGGKLVVETEVVVINGRFRESYPWAQAGRYVLVSVTDTGAGIPPDVLEHVFEPFFSTKPQGTGLGLATAYGVVKRHGGLLHVYSEVGKGTTFKVYLPVADRDASEVGDKIQAPVTGGRERILLAEDEPSVRAVVRRILERAGYDVVVAEDGQQALEYFEQRGDDVHLVLLDAIMPNLNGVEALAGIRAKRPKVAAVLCSGYSEEISKGTNLGDTVAFLAKPYEPDELLRVIRRELDRGKA